MAKFCIERFDVRGSIKLLALAEGYAMARRSGAMPFVMRLSEFEKLADNEEDGRKILYDSVRVTPWRGPGHS